MPDWTHYSAKSKKKGKKEKIGKKGKKYKVLQQYIRKDTQRNIKSFNSIHYLAPALNVSWDEDHGHPRFKLILMHTAFSGAATLQPAWRLSPPCRFYKWQITNQRKQGKPKSSLPEKRWLFSLRWSCFQTRSWDFKRIHPSLQLKKFQSKKQEGGAQTPEPDATAT